MDEYIKREDAIKHLRGACIAKYPLSFSYGIFASADEISKLPTADVAPKSEVERLKTENEKLTINMSAYGLAAKRLQEDVERLNEINNRQVEDIQLAKTEVATEIFEEIYKSLNRLLNENEYATGYLVYDIMKLKKKYTEEKT